MNARKLSILFTCLGLSSLTVSCGDTYDPGFVGQLMVCDVQTQPSRCDADGNMEICAITDWKTETCELGCKSGKCVLPVGAECVVTMCDADGKTLNVCTDGKISKTDCSAQGQVCLGNACGEAPVIVDCLKDEIKCIDGKPNQYLSCSQDGTWLAQEHTCDGDQVCQKVNGKAQCVSPSDLEACTEDVCAEGQLRVCTNGYLGDAQACPSGACDSAKTCAPVVSEEKDCTAGDKKCSEDGKGIVTCTADGTWGESVPCETEGHVCDASVTCVAPEAALKCTAEQIQCVNGTQYQTCVDGNWSETTTECAAETPVCNVDKCEAATVEPPVEACKAVCDGEKIRICDDHGTLKEAADCENGGKCETTDGVAECKAPVNTDPLACTPKSVMCGKNAQIYQVCQADGTWGAAQACEGNKVCDAESAEICVAQCTVGAERCSEGVHQVCSAQGAWTDDPCDANETCDAATNACICTAGATKCEENNRRQVVLKTCQANGTWDNGTQCNNGQYCDTAENKCINTCQPNTERCAADGTHQRCSRDYQTGNNVWKDEPCPANETCSAEKNTCVCTAGATQCITGGGWPVEYLLSTCKDDGTWDEGKRCEGNKVCDMAANGCVDPCTDGEVKCEGASFMQCSDGIWGELTNCGTAEACTATGDVLGCNCTVGSTICLEDSIMECSNLSTGFGADRFNYRGYASTMNTEVCDAGMCKTDANGAYCACVASSVACDGRTLNYCTAEGKWASQNCGQNTCDATLAACINRNASVCTGNGQSCVANQVVTCTNGLYVVTEACGDKVCTESGYGNNTTATCTTANPNERCQRNQKRCSTDLKSVETCSNQQKWEASACKDTEICVETSNYNQTTASCTAKVCDEMAKGCGTGAKANTIQVCNENAWVDLATCADGMTCLAGSCVAK